MDGSLQVKGCLPWRRGREWLWIGWMTMVVVGWLEAGMLWAQAPGEVDRLRGELEQARQEIQQLREENARLRSGGAVPLVAVPATEGGAGRVAAQAGPTPAAGVGASAFAAPVAEGSLVSMDQLLADYGASALVAEARYRGRRIRLVGTVHGFKKVFVGMNWVVWLQADQRLGQVRATVQFPGISDFRLSADDKRLEGRRPFKAWQTLAEVGQPLELEGTVEGLDGSVIGVEDAKVMTHRQ